MLDASLTQAAETTVAGSLVSPLGISLLGIFGLVGLFGPIILILLVANLFGGRSRSHGDPSGLGVAIGIGVVFLITVAINLAVR